MGALAEHYETTALAGGSERFEVTVDDPVFADEAVVRVASVPDEIDPDWEQHLRWPKVQE